MLHGTKRHVRLKLEELEPRSLLATLTGASPDVTGNGALSGGGFPVDAAAVAANATIGFPVGNVNINLAALGVAQTPGAAFSTGLSGPFTGGLNSSAPDATSGLGQITISTGANTPGMGSFATSTLGFASENGGRSGG
ncbi:MAG TPA: hypothetical protein VL175_01755 [Pirellulales bacterium]|jgi:hypothetical protein|nr:hypothetical protein [Pirellulales bacterium]